MKTRIAIFICLALIAAGLAGCDQGQSGQATAVSAAASGGVSAWIDAPLDRMELPLAPYEVVYHGSDPVEVTQVEFTVDGAVLAVDSNPNPADHLITLRRTWNPPGPGNYTLRVRALNRAGTWSEYAQASVTIQEDASPTPTVTATASSVPTLTITPTPSQTPTVTPTPTHGMIGFTPSLSNNQFFFGACHPNDVTISVGVTEPERVFSVVVFFKLEDLESGQITGWDAGASMNPSADRRAYTRTVAAASIANSDNFDKMKVWYQFVATDPSGAIIGRSQNFNDLSLSRCGIVIVKPDDPIHVHTVTPDDPIHLYTITPVPSPTEKIIEIIVD